MPPKKFTDRVVTNPLKDKNVGRRTGKNIKAGKNIRKIAGGFENFDDYWSESEADMTRDGTFVKPVTPAEGPVSRKEDVADHPGKPDDGVTPDDGVKPTSPQKPVHSVSSVLVQSQLGNTDPVRNVFNPFVNKQMGRRTGRDMTAGKNIRVLDNGFENFDDYWSESDADSMVSLSTTCSGVNKDARSPGAGRRTSSTTDIVHQDSVKENTGSKKTGASSTVNTKTFEHNENTANKKRASSAADTTQTTKNVVNKKTAKDKRTVSDAENIKASEGKVNSSQRSKRRASGTDNVMSNEDLESIDRTKRRASGTDNARANEDIVKSNNKNKRRVSGAAHKTTSDQVDVKPGSGHHSQAGHRADTRQPHTAQHPLQGGHEEGGEDEETDEDDREDDREDDNEEEDDACKPNTAPHVTDTGRSRLSHSRLSHSAHQHDVDGDEEEDEENREEVVLEDNGENEDVRENNDEEEGDNASESELEDDCEENNEDEEEPVLEEEEESESEHLDEHANEENFDNNEDVDNNDFDKENVDEDNFDKEDINDNNVDKDVESSEEEEEGRESSDDEEAPSTDPHADQRATQAHTVEPGPQVEMESKKKKAPKEPNNVSLHTNNTRARRSHCADPQIQTENSQTVHSANKTSVTSNKPTSNVPSQQYMSKPTEKCSDGLHYVGPQSRKPDDRSAGRERADYNVGPQSRKPDDRSGGREHADYNVGPQSRKLDDRSGGRERADYNVGPQSRKPDDRSAGREPADYNVGPQSRKSDDRSGGRERADYNVGPQSRKPDDRSGGREPADYNVGLQSRKPDDRSAGRERADRDQDCEEDESEERCTGRTTAARSAVLNEPGGSSNRSQQAGKDNPGLGGQRSAADVPVLPRSSVQSVSDTTADMYRSQMSVTSPLATSHKSSVYLSIAGDVTGSITRLSNTTHLSPEPKLFGTRKRLSYYDSPGHKEQPLTQTAKPKSKLPKALNKTNSKKPASSPIPEHHREGTEPAVNTQKTASLPAAPGVTTKQPATKFTLSTDTSKHERDVDVASECREAWESERGMFVSLASQSHKTSAHSAVSDSEDDCFDIVEDSKVHRAGGKGGKGGKGRKSANTRSVNKGRKSSIQDGTTHVNKGKKSSLQEGTTHVNKGRKSSLQEGTTHVNKERKSSIQEGTTHANNSQSVHKDRKSSIQEGKAQAKKSGLKKSSSKRTLSVDDANIDQSPAQSQGKKKQGRKSSHTGVKGRPVSRKGEDDHVSLHDHVEQHSNMSLNNQHSNMSLSKQHSNMTVSKSVNKQDCADEESQEPATDIDQSVVRDKHQKTSKKKSLTLSQRKDSNDVSLHLNSPKTVNGKGNKKMLEKPDDNDPVDKSVPAQSVNRRGTTVKKGKSKQARVSDNQPSDTHCIEQNTVTDSEHSTHPRPVLSARKTRAKAKQKTQVTDDAPDIQKKGRKRSTVCASSVGPTQPASPSVGKKRGKRSVSGSTKQASPAKQPRVSVDDPNYESASPAVARKTKKRSSSAAIQASPVKLARVSRHDDPNVDTESASPAVARKTKKRSSSAAIQASPVKLARVSRHNDPFVDTESASPVVGKKKGKRISAAKQASLNKQPPVSSVDVDYSHDDDSDGEHEEAMSEEACTPAGDQSLRDSTDSALKSGISFRRFSHVPSSLKVKRSRQLMYHSTDDVEDDVISSPVMVAHSHQSLGLSPGQGASRRAGELESTSPTRRLTSTQRPGSTPVHASPRTAHNAKRKKQRRVTISDEIQHHSYTSPQGSEDREELSVMPSMSCSPVHYHQLSSPASSPHTNHTDRTNKIVYPEDNAVGLRRSQRTRVKPLEWYKNERIVYDRRRSGPVILGVQPSREHLYLQQENIKRRRRRQRLLLKKKQRQWSSGKESKRLSTHVPVPCDLEVTVSTDIPVLHPDTHDEILMSCFNPAGRASAIGPSGGPPSLSDPFTLSLITEQSLFTTGVLTLAPASEKPLQRTMSTAVLYFITYGKVLVTINRASSVLQTGDHFFVPKGTVYRLKNLRKEAASLCFTNLMVEKTETSDIGQHD